MKNPDSLAELKLWSMAHFLDKTLLSFRGKDNRRTQSGNHVGYPMKQVSPSAALVEGRKRNSQNTDRNKAHAKHISWRISASSFWSNNAEFIWDVFREVPQVLVWLLSSGAATEGTFCRNPQSCESSRVFPCWYKWSSTVVTFAIFFILYHSMDI